MNERSLSRCNLEETDLCEPGSLHSTAAASRQINKPSLASSSTHTDIHIQRAAAPLNTNTSEWLHGSSSGRLLFAPASRCRGARQTGGSLYLHPAQCSWSKQAHRHRRTNMLFLYLHLPLPLIVGAGSPVLPPAHMHI